MASMKTIRLAALATTALAGLGMAAAPAAASEKIKLQLGGFFGQVVGYADQDDDYERASLTNYKNFDQKSASEIHVKGETKLDNGIAVGMRVEFESDSFNGDNGTNGNRAFDETFMYLESEMLGRLELGTTSGPAWNLGHRAPNASIIGLNTGDIWVGTVYLALPANHSARGAMGATGADDSSMYNRVNYITPRLMGLAAGLTYVPDAAANNNAAINKNAAAFNGSYWSGTLAYDETIMGVKVGVDGHYARRGVDAATNVIDAKTEWVGGGLNLSYADVTLGGSYERQLSKNATRYNAATTTTSMDGWKWDLGLTYALGPHTFGVTYTKGQTQGAILTKGDDEYSEWVVGYNFNLGPGVDFNASVFRGNYENEVGGAANENDGYGVQAGVLLTF
ncbi:MAG: porin [Magnetospirillum sp. WYHS-4]